MKWKGKYRVIQKVMEHEERDQRMVDHNEEHLIRRNDERQTRRTMRSP